MIFSAFMGYVFYMHHSLNQIFTIDVFQTGHNGFFLRYECYFPSRFTTF